MSSASTMASNLFDNTASVAVRSGGRVSAGVTQCFYLCRGTWQRHHEESVLSRLRAKNVASSGYLLQVLQKLALLGMVGYDIEAKAATIEAVKRLTNKQSSVPLEVVIAIAEALKAEAVARGQVEETKLRSIMNYLYNGTTSAGRGHHTDRDELVDDIYFSFLMVAADYPNQPALQAMLHDVAMQLLDGPQSLGMLLAGGVAQPNGHLSTAQKDGVFQTARAMYNFSGILLAEASNQQSAANSSLAKAQALVAAENQRRQAFANPQGANNNGMAGQYNGGAAASMGQQQQQYNNPALAEGQKPQQQYINAPAAPQQQQANYPTAAAPGPSQPQAAPMAAY